MIKVGNRVVLFSVSLESGQRQANCIIFHFEPISFIYDEDEPIMLKNLCVYLILIHFPVK